MEAKRTQEQKSGYFINQPDLIFRFAFLGEFSWTPKRTWFDAHRGIGKPQELHMDLRWQQHHVVGTEHSAEGGVSF